MEYDDVVRGRRSIRGFKKDPVPRSVICEVLELAMRAPSSLNTQPWSFYVLTGRPLERLRTMTVEKTLSGVPESREFRTRGVYAGVHRERQVEIAKQLFAAMGIERDDKARRAEWTMRGFRQFDAPVSIIVTYDRELEGDDVAPFDCGGVTNAIVNAAWSRGLGCTINSQGVMQSPVVRECAKIPPDQLIQICVAMGYPDEAFPGNAVVSKRKTLAEAATFHGFDDED